MRFSFPDPQSLGGVLCRGLLALPSWIYGGLSSLRAAATARGLWETVRLPIPVFCVGNLTVGGSGKTPAVLWLVDELKKRGHRPALVSRGYGRRSGGEEIFCFSGAPDDLPSVQAVGDEPRLLARRCGVPVAVGADRARAGEKVWEIFRPDCLVLDDGFQHFRLYRDRDFVCLDARRGVEVFLNRAPTPILPAGPWRETPSALGRAHLVFLTRAERVRADRLAALQEALDARGVASVTATGHLTFFDQGTGTVADCSSVDGRRLLALSGLGDPLSFEEALTRLGANVTGLRYGDHHVFSSTEIDAALGRARREGRRLVVTEKDWERLPAGLDALVARLTWTVQKETRWEPLVASAFI